jgi:hypothetical protein
MPEPVVIIGPAARPAGPTSASAENAAEADAVATGLHVQKSPKSDDRKRSSLLPALARVASGLSALAVRAFLALSRAGLNVASRYPRHSLAAGASILILGAVLYAQLRPGKGTRPPVIAEIPGDNARLVANSSANSGPAKSANVTKDGSRKESGHNATAPNPDTATPGGPTTVRSDVNPPSDKSSSAPAPEVTALVDAPPPLPSIAEAPAPTQERQPAPDKVASTSEPAVLPKAEPPATPVSAPDQAAATLLAQAPPEAAPSPSSSTVKDDTGSTDPVKTAAAPPPATAADLSPSTTQSVGPASLPAPAGDPLQLAGALEPVGDQKESIPT